MTQGYVRPTRWEDVPTLAENMREADIAEVKASAGIEPSMALFIGIMEGETNTICLPDGTPAGIYGVTPTVTPGLGCVWMLATNELRKVHRQFLRESRQGIADLCKDYRAVYNYTDARNKVHHRWIEWAGFTFIKRHERFGFEQRPFLEFVRITEVHNV
jgi:hypothetical protein